MPWQSSLVRASWPACSHQSPYGCWSWGIYFSAILERFSSQFRACSSLSASFSRIHASTAVPGSMVQCKSCSQMRLIPALEEQRCRCRKVTGGRSQHVPQPSGARAQQEFVQVVGSWQDHGHGLQRRAWGSSRCPSEGQKDALVFVFFFFYLIKGNNFSCKPLSCVQFFVTPWTVPHQAPLSMEFSRQGYWSGLPFPSPGDISDSGIQLDSPALRADSLSSETPGKPHKVRKSHYILLMK